MAQRYPFLFDGIIARAPAYNFTGLMLAFQRNAQAMAVAGAALSHDEISMVADKILGSVGNKRLWGLGQNKSFHPAGLFSHILRHGKSFIALPPLSQRRNDVPYPSMCVR